MPEGTAEEEFSINLIEVTSSECSGKEVWRFCYTKMLLKSVLQFMGCKTRVAHKAKINRFSQPEHSDKISETFTCCNHVLAVRWGGFLNFDIPL